MSKMQEALDEDQERNKSFYFAEDEAPTVYRVTGIQDAESCGMYWRSSFIGRESNVQDKYAETGTLIHLILQDEMSAFANRPRILTEDDRAQIRARLDELGENQTLANLYGKYLMRLLSYVIGCEIVDIEGQYTIPNIHITLEGKADLVLRDKTGAYKIIDHKTNRRPQPNHAWEAKFQMQAYANAVCEKYDIPEVTVIVGNVNLDEDNIFVVRRSVSAMNLRIGRAMRNIQHYEEEAYRRVGAHCKYCKVSADCESHKKMKENGNKN